MNRKTTERIRPFGESKEAKVHFQHSVLRGVSGLPVSPIKHMDSERVITFTNSRSKKTAVFILWRTIFTFTHLSSLCFVLSRLATFLNHHGPYYRLYR